MFYGFQDYAAFALNGIIFYFNLKPCTTLEPCGFPAVFYLLYKYCPLYFIKRINCKNNKPSIWPILNYN